MDKIGTNTAEFHAIEHLVENIRAEEKAKCQEHYEKLIEQAKQDERAKVLAEFIARLNELLNTEDCFIQNFIDNLKQGNSPSRSKLE